MPAKKSSTILLTLPGPAQHKWLPLALHFKKPCWVVLKLGNAKLLGNSFEVVKSIVFFFFSLLFLQTAIIYFIDQNIVGSFNASYPIGVFTYSGGGQQQTLSRCNLMFIRVLLKRAVFCLDTDSLGRCYKPLFDSQNPLNCGNISMLHTCDIVLYFIFVQYTIGGVLSNIALLFLCKKKKKSIGSSLRNKYWGYFLYCRKKKSAFF
ncbi:hypothetical protein AB205_0070710 [Aquarana catesbeiana]|uniref:Uncharacterized protein n=1 Tax=Aquarana catesbeiana TaxID=8400 RepID=A0A2G9S5F7_AQUCT|nr:hypothetical protein AB205_0070710 [Aquarana catesbeiana]